MRYTNAREESRLGRCRLYRFQGHEPLSRVSRKLRWTCTVHIRSRLRKAHEWAVSKLFSYGLISAFPINVFPISDFSTVRQMFSKYTRAFIFDHQLLSYSLHLHESTFHGCTLSEPLSSLFIAVVVRKEGKQVSQQNDLHK